MILPPEYGRLYEEPSEPVTCTEPALDAVTVTVSDCPEEMLLDCAAMETVGSPGVEPPDEPPEPEPEPEPTATVVAEELEPLEFVAVAV